MSGLSSTGAERYHALRQTWQVKADESAELAEQCERESRAAAARRDFRTACEYLELGREFREAELRARRVCNRLAVLVLDCRGYRLTPVGPRRRIRRIRPGGHAARRVAAQRPARSRERRDCTGRSSARSGDSSTGDSSEGPPHRESASSLAPPRRRTHDRGDGEQR